MNTYYYLKISTFLLIFSLSAILLHAQDMDREIIIIEKTIDADGKVISKNIKRNKGNYSEDDVQKMIEENDNLPYLRSFDLEGMGFGEDLESLFSPQRESKPTLGVVLKEENGQLLVKKVSPGSGADNVDIRAGDKIISIDHLPVSTVADIKEILDKHNVDDKVKVTIWRDGSELEKNVALKNNRFKDLLGGLDFNLPEGGSLRFFGGGSDFDLDSLLSQFRNLSPDLFDFDGFDMDQFKDLRGLNKKLPNYKEKKDRPQLGLFIEDQSEGIVITEVLEDTPAAVAKLKTGDIITHIDDNIVQSYRELGAWMNTKSYGDEITITVIRKGKKRDVKVVLE